MGEAQHVGERKNVNKNVGRKIWSEETSLDLEKDEMIKMSIKKPDWTYSVFIALKIGTSSRILGKNPHLTPSSTVPT